MIDKIKLNHWLNIRKTTLSVLNEKLRRHSNFKIDFENLDGITENSAKLISQILDIDLNEI